LLEDKYVDTGSIAIVKAGKIILWTLGYRFSFRVYDITVKEAFARSSNVASQRWLMNIIIIISQCVL